MLPEMMYMQNTDNKNLENKIDLDTEIIEDSIQEEIDQEQLAEGLDHFGSVAINLQNIIQSLSSTVKRLEGKLHNLEKRIEETEKKD